MSVFISYAMHDKAFIKKVIGELKSRGIVEQSDQIIDVSDFIVDGSSMRGQVQRAIEAASKVVVVWSGAGAKSVWVNYEAGMADALGKPLFVVIPKGEASRIPRELENIQILELENVG